MSTFTVPIVTVKEVIKHPNADSLDLITFNEIGWRCVDKLGVRKPGDKVVYIPIDSMVDTKREEFAFLAPKAKPDGRFRIRTVKLRGEVSQGLIVDCPAALRTEMTDQTPEPGELIINPVMFPVVGLDCSYHFDIKKYEPQEYGHTLSANQKGFYPSWLPKTDAERYQNFNRDIEQERSTVFGASLKLDGTSMTVFEDLDREDDVIGVCSRNFELYEKDATGGGNIYWQTARSQDLITKLQDMRRFLRCKKIALQGELCGPGIQGNKMGLDKVTFFLFDIYTVDDTSSGYVNYAKFMEYANLFQLQTVPVLWVETLENKLGFPFDFSFISDLKYPNGTPAEGVVFVSAQEKYVGKLGRLKFKFINPTFLLKYEG